MVQSTTNRYRSIDEKLKAEWFKIRAIFNNSELIKRIGRQIQDLEKYDYRILPFAVAMEGSPDYIPMESDEGLHIIYIKQG